MVPSPKFVTQTKRPSLDAIAQQTSLRVSATEPETGRSEAPSRLYDEAAALPTAPPKASVTTSVEPAKSKPYGVAPTDGFATGSPSSPSSPTANVVIPSVPRSVTTSVRPSGLKATWAGSVSGRLSGRVELSS